MTSSPLARAAASVVLCSFLAAQYPAQAARSQVPPTPKPVAEGFGQGAYRPQAGISGPLDVRRALPVYTAEAMRARIEGEVVLEAVVLADGTVGPVRVVQSLDTTFGLDQEAVKAAQRWFFHPGMLKGTAVPCLITLVMEFSDYVTGDSAGYLGRGQAGERPQVRIPPVVSWVPDVVFLKDVARLGQPNVTMPVLERGVEPKYTSAAMHAKIAGTVTVDMVVGPDGSVVRSRVARSLDPTFGLDRSALEAASQWRFKPGLVNGQPSHVLVTVTMEFRLH